MVSRICFNVTFLRTLTFLLEKEHDFIYGVGTHLNDFLMILDTAHQVFT
jgi:hypothetical protein